MKDSELKNEEIQEQVIISEHDAFSIQPGFVESIIAEGESYPNLTKAFQKIFRNNKEFAVILWNNIPVRISYIEDIPYLVYGILLLIDDVWFPNKEQASEMHFSSPNVETQWTVLQKKNQLIIESNWIRVSGNYEAALNNLSTVIVSREKFLSEWKVLIQQMAIAVTDAKAILTDETDILILGKLKHVARQMHVLK